MPLASATAPTDGGIYVWVTELAQRSPLLWTRSSASGPTTGRPCSPC